jgi:hypothetical protein
MKKRMLSFRKPAVLLLIGLLLLSSMSFAGTKKHKHIETSDMPTEAVIFTDEFVVSSDGGRFDIGFAQVDFRKSCTKDLPITFEAKIYADDGLVYTVN